jgi:hypothetical protein
MRAHKKYWRCLGACLDALEPVLNAFELVFRSIGQVECRNVERSWIDEHLMRCIVHFLVVVVVVVVVQHKRNDDDQMRHEEKKIGSNTWPAKSQAEKLSSSGSLPLACTLTVHSVILIPSVAMVEGAFLRFMW